MAVRAMMERVNNVNNVLDSDQAIVGFAVFFKDTTSGNAANELMDVVIDFGQTQSQRRAAIESAIIAKGEEIGFPGLAPATVFLYDWV